MTVQIDRKDILDCFDDGKTFLLSKKDYENLVIEQDIIIDQINCKIKIIKKSKNRILVTIG